MDRTHLTQFVTGPRHAGQPGDRNAPAPISGHHSFRSAFEETVQVTGVGAAPHEIRVRWNPGSRTYTWSVRY